MTTDQAGRDPDALAAADPLGAASGLTAAEDDPDAATAASLPGHGADDRASSTDGTGTTGAGTGGDPRREPPVGPPSQDAGSPPA